MDDGWPRYHYQMVTDALSTPRQGRNVKDKLLQAQKDLSEGTSLPPKKQPLKQYLETWLEESVRTIRRPSTFTSYSTNVRLHITPELGRITLAQLTAQDVQRFMNRMSKRGLSPRTVQYNHTILRRALNQAKQWKLVTENVAQLASPPRVPKANIQPLTPVEVKNLLEAIRNDRLKALYTVALAVGLRQGEALGLRWQDLNLEAGTLTVRAALQRVDGKPVLVEPKTDKSYRTIKLPDICITALSEHKEQQSLERAFVGEGWHTEWNLVFAKEDGTPLSRHQVTRRFQRILANAGITKHRFHDLRQTCATLLLAQGIPLKVVQETLGHTLFSTTADIYAHVLPVLMADAAQKMNAVLTEL